MIEKRTGRELTDYMENEIFLPLGMKDTLAEYEPSRSSEIVTAYSPNNNPFPIKYDLPAGGAGFYSSAHDLILFGMFHLKNHLLNQKQIISDSTLSNV